MNYTVLLVSVVLLIAIPSAMWSIFRMSQDTHTYSNHYRGGGFHPELPEDCLDADPTRRS